LEFVFPCQYRSEQSRHTMDVGPSSETPPFVIDQRWMAIDGSAGTGVYRFDGDFAKLEFLKYDVTNLAYYIRHAGRAGVIGVGGGRDILSAHLFGFSGYNRRRAQPDLHRYAVASVSVI
jgi:hypothetical protein